MRSAKPILAKLVVLMTAGCAFISVATVSWIMLTIIWGGAGHSSWNFLSAAPAEGMTEGGTFPAIFGTFLVGMAMSIVGVPIGTITAVYLRDTEDRQSKLA